MAAPGADNSSPSGEAEHAVRTENLMEKLKEECQARYDNDDAGVPAAEAMSMAKNLIELLQSIDPKNDSDPDNKFRSKNSGQFKFRTNKNFATDFTDGTRVKGLHGIKLFAGGTSDYKGPLCAQCGCMNDLSRCSGCKKVWYCDRNCQLKHWSAGHQSACKRNPS
jgi:hypothetical protein